MTPNDPRSDGDQLQPPPGADGEENALPGSGAAPANQPESGALHGHDFIPEVIPVLPAAGPGPATQPARLPGPGFWMSAVWCIALWGVMLVAGIPVLVVSLVAQTPPNQTTGEFLESLSEQMAGSKRLQPAVGALAGGGGKALNDRFNEKPPVPLPLARALGWLMLVAELASVLFAVVIVRVMVGRNWPRILAVRIPRGEHIVLALIALPGLMLLHGAAHELAERLIPTSESAQNATRQMLDVFRPWPRWLTVLVIGVAPGIGEELWCRGFLGRGLLARYGWTGGVLLTSLFFGLLHLAPAYAFGTAVMGVCLHFTYITTRSLLVPMLLHGLNNSLTMLVGFGDVPLQNLDPDPNQPPPLLLYGSSLVLVAAVGYALYASRSRLQAPGGGPPAWQPPFPSVALPPPDSDTEVVHETPPPLAIICVMIGAVAFGVCWYFA